MAVIRPTFKVERILLANVFIDFGYQRETRTDFIEQNVAEFRPELVNCPILSLRKDGRYAVIDGGHRYLMMKELGIEEWDFIVHTGLSVKEEADMFVEMNFRRNSVRPYERYKAMIAAGVPLALALRKVVEEEGYFISSSAAGENDIGAIASLEEVFLVLPHETPTTAARHYEVRKWITTSDMAGPDLLSKTLRVIRKAWFERDSWPQAKSGNVIRGVARFLAANPGVTEKEMVRVLGYGDPLLIQQESRLLQKPGAGSGKGRPVEAVITRLYAQHGNKNMLS